MSYRETEYACPIHGVRMLERWDTRPQEYLVTPVYACNICGLELVALAENSTSDGRSDTLFR